jgi:hypothetical protein
MRNVYTQKFGTCDQVLDYLEKEYHYSAQELDFLEPAFSDLMENMLAHNLLDPQSKEEYDLMKTGIDNFFYETVVKSRRKKMLM